MADKPFPKTNGFDPSWEVPSFECSEFFDRRTPYVVCIPVINEGERIRKELAEMAAFGIGEQADIIILDGGSTDGSLEEGYLKSMGVRALLTKTGPGRLSAQLRMGYAYGLAQGYEGLVTIDGNNKDGVEAIPRFIRELEAGYDLVQGSRYLPGGQAINTPWLRHWANKLIHVPLVNRAAGFHYSDTTNGFRGYSRRLLLSPEVRPFRDVFGGYELLVYLSVRTPQTGHRVKEIPVTRRYPPRGKTPTKIGHLRGNLHLLACLFKGLSGSLNPKSV
jgi:dolichol-phosphate mannosyltransferase